MPYSPRPKRQSWDSPKKFGGPRPFNKGGYGRPGEDRPMFKAVCSECQSRCEVPFRPNGKKPVLCSNCFKPESRDFQDKPFSNDRGFNKFDKAPRFNQENGFDTDCDECGQRCNVPFKPNGKKLVFCRDCFDGKNDKSAGTGEQSAPKTDATAKQLATIAEQLKAMNIKIDNILKALHKETDISQDLNDLE